MVAVVPDVSERHRAVPTPTVLALAMRALADQQGWPLAIKDVEDQRYLWVNGAFAALTGRAPEAVIGCSDADLFDAPIVTALRASDHAVLLQGSNAALSTDHRLELHGERREFVVLRQVDRSHPGQALLLALWRDQGPQRRQAQQLALALEQIEQQQKANEALRRELAERGPRDHASGLSSRVHFDDQMRRELDLSVREHREFSLVYIALDPLSPRVADLGERALERIGEAMGRLLKGNTRAMDASCRLNDRNFAVLLSGVGLATAHSRMEGLRRQCATQIVMLDGERLEFTVSMGVASFPHTAAGQDELSNASSAALTEAQRRGGNTVALASIRFESD